MGKDLKWKRTKTGAKDDKAFLLSENWCNLLLSFNRNLPFFLPGLWMSHGCHHTEIIQQPGKYTQPVFTAVTFVPHSEHQRHSEGPTIQAGTLEIGFVTTDGWALSVVPSAPADRGRCQQRELSLGLRERERGVFLRFTLDPSAEGQQRARNAFRENSSPFWYPSG